MKAGTKLRRQRRRLIRDLSRHMESAGLNEADVADLVGVQRQQVIRWLTTESIPTTATSEKIKALIEACDQPQQANPVPDPVAEGHSAKVEACVTLVRSMTYKEKATLLAVIASEALQ